MARKERTVAVFKWIREDQAAPSKDHTGSDTAYNTGARVTKANHLTGSYYHTQLGFPKHGNVYAKNEKEQVIHE